MNRIYYLRDRTNICQKTDGSFTRGNPVACVITTVDRALCSVKYAVSAIHPKYNFDRALARIIASGRLEVKPVVVQSTKEMMASSHLITKSVMQHIYDTNQRGIKGSSSVLRQRSQEWLERAALPKVVARGKSVLTMPQAPGLSQPTATHGLNTGT